MIRKRLADGLKSALKKERKTDIAILRLILAALKDRDNVAQSNGHDNGIGDEEIGEMLTKMVRQRGESIARYEQGGQIGLVQKERREIAVIESLLPRQLDPEETAAAVAAVIGEVGATGVKDVGRTMTALKARYSGQMDFVTANAMVKEALCARRR